MWMRAPVQQISLCHVTTVQRRFWISMVTDLLETFTSHTQGKEIPHGSPLIEEMAQHSGSHSSPLPMRINRGCTWAKLKKLCIKGTLLWYPFVECPKIIVQLSRFCSNFPIIVFIFSNYDILIYSTPIADLYSLSYLWISGLSFGATIVVGVIASFALGNYTWPGAIIGDGDRKRAPFLVLGLAPWYGTIFLLLEQIAPSPAAHARTLLRGFSRISRRGNGVRNSRNGLRFWPTTQRFYGCWILIKYFRCKLLQSEWRQCRI